MRTTTTGIRHARCKNCDKPCVIHTGGRCYQCWRDRNTRRQAARIARGVAVTPANRTLGERFRSGQARRPEPTLAEIDAMIAQQMQCLPDWWDRETRRVREGKA